MGKDGGMEMETSMGYRLMQGKNGITGYVRRKDAGDQLVIRGLYPGALCDIYKAEENKAERSMSLPADKGGQLIYQSDGFFHYFAAVQGRVILWEQDGRQDENYLQACALLLKSISEKKKREEKHCNTDTEEKTEERIAAAEIPCDPEPILPEEEKCTEEETREYSLRAPGSGEAADALPSLLWPETVKDLQVYFSSLTPFSPFDLPDWRFVKAPSPVRECAYCALGYGTANDRVTKIAYALPGGPFYPPANLSGYRYYPGRNGQGYWVTVRDAEK